MSNKKEHIVEEKCGRTKEKVHAGEVAKIIALRGSPSMAKGVGHLRKCAFASGAYPAEVRGFESHPPHLYK